MIEIQPIERVDMTQRVDQVRRRIAAIEKMIGINGADFQTTLEREIARQAALNPAEPAQKISEPKKIDATQKVAEVQKLPGATQPVNEREAANAEKVAQALRDAEKTSPPAQDATPADKPAPLPGQEALPGAINPSQQVPPQAAPPQQPPKIERVEFPDTEPEVPSRDDKILSDNYLGANDQLTSTEELIMQTAYEHGVDPKLVRAIAIAESDMNQDEVSDAGAIGVMQLMPETAAALGVNPYDKRDNIVGGAMYIRQMLDTFDGDVPLAVAAYNAGPGAVKRYGGIPPYAETQHYVGRVMDMYQ